MHRDRHGTTAPNPPDGFDAVLLGARGGRTRWTARHGNRLLAVFVVDDRLVAVDARCPHNAGHLENGLVSDGVLMCPSHCYRFELETGRCLTAPRYELARYDVVESGGIAWAFVPKRSRAARLSEFLRARTRSRPGRP